SIIMNTYLFYILYALALFSKLSTSKSLLFTSIIGALILCPTYSLLNYFGKRIQVLDFALTLVLHNFLNLLTYDIIAFALSTFFYFGAPITLTIVYFFYVLLTTMEKINFLSMMKSSSIGFDSILKPFYFTYMSIRRYC